MLRSAARSRMAAAAGAAAVLGLLAVVVLSRQLTDGSSEVSMLSSTDLVMPPSGVHRAGLEKRLHVYGQAVHSAKQSHTDMQKLVHYYDNAHLQTYHDVLQAHANMIAAQSQWAKRRYALEKLNYEITKEQNTLHTLHSTEGILRTRHQALQKELIDLLKASDEVHKSLLKLKGHYSRQVDENKRRFEREERRIAIQRSDAKADMIRNRKDERANRHKVRDAMKHAAYFSEEAKHISNEIEDKREKARKKEAEEAEMYDKFDRAYKMRVQQEHIKADSKANQKSAQVDTKSVSKIIKLDTKSSRQVDKIRSRAVAIEAKAEAKKQISRAAEVAVETARTLEETLEQENTHLRAEIDKQENEVIDAQGRASTARVQSEKYSSLMDASKRAYDQVKEDEKDTRERIKAAQKIVDGATAKRIVAEAETKMADLIAEGDQAESRKRVEQAADADYEGARRISRNKKKTRRYTRKREYLLREGLGAWAVHLEAQNAAYLQHGKADLMDTVSDEVLKHAQKKLDRADALVKKVEALSDLTSEAATQAREDQIQSEVAAKVSEIRGPAEPEQNIVYVQQPESEPLVSSSEASDSNPASINAQEMVHTLIGDGGLSAKSGRQVLAGADSEAQRYAHNGWEMKGDKGTKTLSKLGILV